MLFCARGAKSGDDYAQPFAAIAMIILLAVPSPALADKKKTGTDYNTIEGDYTKQKRLDKAAPKQGTSPSPTATTGHRGK
jgi:hypothetical protein